MFTFWERLFTTGDSVDRCCFKLILCWLMLTVLTCFEKSFSFFWELCCNMLAMLTVLTLQKKMFAFWERLFTTDDSVDRCWLCWRCRKRCLPFEKVYLLLMTVLIDVASSWCCVDWCWQCWYVLKKASLFSESFFATCCPCWLCWRCRKRCMVLEKGYILLMTVLIDVSTSWCCVDWCWQMLTDVDNIFPMRVLL